MLLNFLQYTGLSPTTKNYPDQNVNRARLKKLCCRLWFLTQVQGAQLICFGQRILKDCFGQGVGNLSVGDKAELGDSIEGYSNSFHDSEEWHQGGTEVPSHTIYSWTNNKKIKLN